MATTYNQDILYSRDITASAASAGEGVAPDRRRKYDFSDRVAELRPDRSPFFVYLSKTAKVPVSDSIFRYLENRSFIDWTGRDFYIDGNVNGGSAVTVNNNYAFTVDNGSSASIDWLVKGMVFTVTTVYTTTGMSQVTVRIEDTPVIASADTSFSGKIIGLSITTTANYNIIGTNLRCQVIGTSFGEGTGSPDVWSSEIEDNFGYTQIFKTAAEMSNTARAIVYRGYADEWKRLWASKLVEHASDIERSMLFSQRNLVNNLKYTEGMVGQILKNSTVVDGASALTYSSGKAYFHTVTTTELTYDLLLGDMEVVFDPAQGGSQDRLALASRPIITFFNKLGDGMFLDTSVGYQYSPFRLDQSESDGKFGHKLLNIETIHGSIHLVSEPMFRNNSRNLMLWVDMENVKYRPLVGNGLNRDTSIETNVQNNDEDLRKDMILTEAGLEITLPETHILYSLEGI